MTAAAIELAKPLVKHFEGLKLVPYRDAVGLLTIGWGHNMTGDGLAGNSVAAQFLRQYFPPVPAAAQKLAPKFTEAAAEQLLSLDLAKARNDVQANLPGTVVLQDKQLAGLMAFVFNVGRGRWMKSTMRKCVEHGLYDAAALEFQQWTKAGGKVLPGLVLRREKEFVLYKTGIFTV